MKNLRGKTFLITGGTGFVGSALCAALGNLEANIIVLSRRQRLSNQKISFIRSLSEIHGRDIDVIINLAGEPIAQRWTAKTKIKIKKSRIDTTSLLIDFIKSAPKKPELLISGSAIGYYGTDPSAEFNEMSLPASGAPFSRALCASWEAEASKTQQYGVRTVYLRIGAVLEKDGGMLSKLLLPFRLGLGGPIGKGEQCLSWIDRDDLLNLIIHIVHTPSLEGPINATSPNPVTNIEFTKALSETLKKPCKLRTPAFILSTVYGDMAEEIMLEGQKVFPAKALASGFIFSYSDIRKCLRKILQTGNDKK